MLDPSEAATSARESAPSSFGTVSPVSTRMTWTALPITSAGRFSPFGPVGMARLPHGLSEMLRNRCHSAIDDNLMFFVEDDRDRFNVNFNDKANELRVNCDAFATPAFCQERKVIYHPCAP
jgi:hypothetical protein